MPGGQLYQQKLDETREELKSTYSETIKSMYKNEIDATQANIDRLHQAITAVSTQLAKLNQTMTEYRMLQERERQKLRNQQNKLNEEIGNIQQFALALPRATAEWASRRRSRTAPASRACSTAWRSRCSAGWRRAWASRSCAR